MNDYNFWADLLNKYSQLTPWVQALSLLAITVTLLGIMYFLKEIVIEIKNK